MPCDPIPAFAVAHAIVRRQVRDTHLAAAGVCLMNATDPSLSGVHGRKFWEEQAAKHLDWAEFEYLPTDKTRISGRNVEH